MMITRRDVKTVRGATVERVRLESPVFFVEHDFDHSDKADAYIQGVTDFSAALSKMTLPE